MCQVGLSRIRAFISLFLSFLCKKKPELSDKQSAWLDHPSGRRLCVQVKSAKKLSLAGWKKKGDPGWDRNRASQQHQRTVGFPALRIDATGRSYKYSVWGVTSRTTTPSVHLGTPARGTRGCSGARHAGTCSRQLRAGAPPGRLLPAGPGAAGRASGRRSAMLESIRVTGEYRCRGCCPGAGAEAGAEARRRRFPRSRRGKHAGWAM